MRRNLRAYFSELAGSAIVLFIGVSAVSVMAGSGSPVPIGSNGALRRLLTGIMFAGGATAVVYLPFGQISGGDINPAVTLGFRRLGVRRVNKHDLGHVLAEVRDRTGELLRQRVRGVKAANERMAGRV